MQVDNSGSGIGVGGLFTVLFIVGKLSGFITASWWWVLLPLAVTLVCVFIILFVAAVLVALNEQIKGGE